MGTQLVRRAGLSSNEAAVRMVVHALARLVLVLEYLHSLRKVSETNTNKSA